MIEHIPLNRLDLAVENVRKHVDDRQIEKLAVSINMYGLKQNLIGYQTDNGGVLIVGGGSRLRALLKLAKDGEIQPDELVPVLIEDREAAVKASLTENEIRSGLNVVDKLRAYKAMQAEGANPDEVMLAFGVDAKAYSNTMRLAGLPDDILDHLGAGLMSLDHAAAYALGTPEQALDHFHAVIAQKKKFADGWGNISYHDVKREMTGGKVAESDKRANFVGRSAYEKAGGTITEDLFSDKVMFDDEKLLHDLALAKLAKEAKKIAKAEGWAHVEVGIEAPSWDTLRTYGRLYPETRSDATEEEIAEYDDLAELANGDAIDEAGEKRLAELEAKLEVETYTEAQKKIGCVFLSVGWNGKAERLDPMVRPDDIDEAVAAGVMAMDKYQPSADAGGSDEKDQLAYSNAVLADLQIVRRTAIQCELLNKPAKVIDAFLVHAAGDFLNAPIRFDMTGHPTTRPNPGMLEQGLTPDPRLIACYAGKQKWKKTDAGREDALVAELASRIESVKDYTPDVRKWWTPNAAWFQRLSKAQLIEIICEIGAGQLAGVNNAWDKYKKGDLCTAIAGFFDGTTKHGTQGNGTRGPAAEAAVAAAKTWLPPSLRPEALVKPGDDVDNQPDEDEAAAHEREPIAAE